MVLTQMVLTVPSSGGLQAKLKLVCEANKFKLASFRLSAAAALALSPADTMLLFCYC